MLLISFSFPCYVFLLCLFMFCVLCLMFPVSLVCPFVNAPSVFTRWTFRRIHVRCCNESGWGCIFCIFNRNTARSGYNTVQLTWPKQKRPSLNIHEFPWDTSSPNGSIAVKRGSKWYNIRRKCPSYSCYITLFRCLIYPVSPSLQQQKWWLY